MSEQKPSIGRIVRYSLTADNATAINKRRKDAQNLNADGVTLAGQQLGAQIHTGNQVSEGDVFPMVITRVWGDQPDSAVNGQVFLDGNDLFWATSALWGDAPGRCMWPLRQA